MGSGPIQLIDIGDGGGGGATAGVILAATQYAPADFASYSPSTDDGVPHPLDETNLSITFTPPTGVTQVKVLAKISASCNQSAQYDFGLSMWDFGSDAQIGFIDTVYEVQTPDIITGGNDFGNFYLDQLYTVVAGTEYHWGLASCIDASPVDNVTLYAWGITAIGPPPRGASPAVITVWSVPS